MSKNCQLGKNFRWDWMVGSKRFRVQRFKGQECGFQKRAGVSVQVSVNREQGRKQMSDKVLYHPVFTIRLLVPDTCNLMCTKTKN